MTDSTEFRTARRRYLLVAGVAPLLVAVVAVALMVSWLPEVPSTVATHWSGDGTPDGFAPAWTVPLGAALLSLGLAALFAVIMLTGTRDGRWGPNLRLLAAFSIGTTVLLDVCLTWSLGMQRGLDDPAEAPGMLLPVLAGTALGLLAGVAGWFAQPAVTVSGDRPAPTVEALRLAPGERAVWARTTTMARGAKIAIVASFTALALGALVVAALGSPVWWAMLATAALLALLACATFVFRVRIDEHGLVARSPLGFPRFQVPLDEVQGVAVTMVSPTAEFGGWGIRVGADGALGIILRAGEALEVSRTRGRRFVVTIDDAATAAALLEALSERARERRH
ncbi:DUF1648 domain-containing protein [Agromyces lapidis]|uniref:DUF1648 domain-containing protein n=1 Tax=Agromyces lapidis TaxID=279574 RepID=A0ABV5STF4_9MICO|nr:DUF1648 domain-containing protein [Agromyces lapidis]